MLIDGSWDLEFKCGWCDDARDMGLLMIVKIYRERTIY